MEETVGIAATYSWEPFTFEGKHLTFQQLTKTRLEKRLCSTWGPAIYKWEGELGKGNHSGKIGVLIGETDDLRHRIKEYITGTQEKGNKRWREQFLTKGIIRLNVLGQVRGQISLSGGQGSRIDDHSLSSDHVRKLLEKLLILKEVEQFNSTKKWIVNREWSRRP